MSEQFKILVVCLGNVCRSPLAERLLRLRFDQMLGAGSPDVEVTSAGVRALVGSAMDELSAAELERLGGQTDGFASRQVTGAMAGSADLVLTATRSQRSRVLEEAPRALKRTFTLREFAAISASPALRTRPLAGPVELVSRAASWRGAAQVDDYDVPDPIGRTPVFHRSVADLLDADCTTIAEAVTGALLSDVSPR